MGKQIIITVGREFGSGGHHIAEILAQRLGIKLYDKELMSEIGYNDDYIKAYDEKPVSFFMSSRVGPYSSSLEEMVASKTFKFIKELADRGESFVIVGRCSEYVLHGNPNTFNIFILGEYEEKLKRIEQLYSLDEKKAAELIRKTDKSRKMYHNYYCDTKWGDSRGYDLCINSSKLGVDKTADLIYDIISKQNEL